MKYKMITVLLALFSISISAQDSLNCRLLSTTGDMVDAYSMAVNNNYAFVAGEDGFSILDISDIYNPEEVYSHSNIFSGSICIQEDLAYIASAEYISIWDISQIDAPKVLANYKAAIRAGSLEEIFVSENIAYVGSNYSLLVIDVSNPKNPIEISRIEGYENIMSIDVRKRHLFATTEYSGVIIYDISDPEAPVELTKLPVPAFWSVKLNDNVVYATDRYTLYAFDISDAENPVKICSLKYGGGRSIDIEGNYLYALTNKVHGDNSQPPRLTVVDISNPQDLKIAGYYQLHDIGEKIVVRNNVAIATCRANGIYFIQFDEPTTVVDVHRNAPGYSLAQNYPNPLNPCTNISYTLPVETGHPASAGQVTPSLHSVSLIVYDILGREVATLVNEKQKPGSYTVRFDAGHLSSGVYFYKLQADNFLKTNKMILLK